LSTFVTKVEDKNSKIFNLFDIKDNEYLFDLEAKSDWFPDGVIGDNITGYLKFIVTNIVHYLSFKSVFNVQKPDKVMIHWNCDKLEGNFWNRLKSEIEEFDNKIIIRRIEKTGHIFGVKFANVWHESDVVRNKVSINLIFLKIDFRYFFKTLFDQSFKRQCIRKKTDSRIIKKFFSNIL
jgi:hypothetical protein